MRSDCAHILTNEGVKSIRWATVGAELYIVPFPINITAPLIRTIHADTYQYSGLDNSVDVRLCDEEGYQDWRFRVYKRPDGNGPGFYVRYILIAL